MELKEEVHMSKFNPYSIQNQLNNQRLAERRGTERNSSNKYLFLQSVLHPISQVDSN